MTQIGTSEKDLLKEEELDNESGQNGKRRSTTSEPFGNIAPLSDILMVGNLSSNEFLPSDLILQNGEKPTLKKEKCQKSGNIPACVVIGIRNGVHDFIIKHKTVIRYLFYFGIFLGYNAYLAAAVAYTIRNEIKISWCDGLGFLIALTGIVYWSLFYYIVLKGVFGSWLHVMIVQPVNKIVRIVSFNRWGSVLIGILGLAAVLTFVVIDCWDEPRRLVSAGGIFILLFVLFICSKHPGNVRWRQVLAGLGMQFVFGILVLRWDGGRIFVECISGKVHKFLSFVNEGSTFIYDFAASGQLKILNSTMPELIGHTLRIPTTFAFTILSTVFFLGFVVQLLYHIGAMLWLVRKLGWLLQVLIGTSAAESMSAAANIFLGMSESALLIKPFINDLTKSELHAVMSGGFATIAGSVMAAYISFGVKAESVLSASVMAAPCALALSKLMYPEVEESRTTVKHLKHVNINKTGNALDSAARGAVEGVTLIGFIIANTLAVISFVALANAVLGWFGSHVGFEELTFEWLLGKAFIPVALCIGVAPSESEKIGQLIGLKVVVNEFLAYGKLQQWVADGLVSERSRRLAEYSLCGFANFSSMGILLGAMGVMAPSRRAELSQIVWRALMTGATSSFVNACVAGTLLSFDDIIMDDSSASNATATTSSMFLL